MRRALGLTLLALAAACGRDAPKPRAAPEPGTLSDEWYVLRIEGLDAGYHHVRAVQHGEVLECTIETQMRTEPVWVERSVSVSEERASDGALLRLRTKHKGSNCETETDVRFDAGRATVATTVMEETRESAMEVPPDLLGPWRIEQLTRDARRNPGACVEARAFPYAYGPVTFAITVVGDEEVELLDGKRERLTRVERTAEGNSLRSVGWLDAAGNWRKVVYGPGLTGIAIECHLVPEERARKALEGKARPQIARALPAPHPILCPRRLDRATYRIRGKGLPALADERQSVESAGDGTVVLRIERRVPPQGRTGTRPIANPPAELLPCLDPSSMVQSDAPEVVAIARDIAGLEPDAWKAARELESWVAENVRPTFAFETASALEVARTRAGDCSECAVLLCALCRAAGIPARCARGFELVSRGWGYHAWTEVWIDGAWYGLDGTLGEGSVDPAHITLCRTTLADTAFGEGHPACFDVEIDATEFVLNGWTLRAGEDPGHISGFRYRNPVFGIAFTCPEGYCIETSAPGHGRIVHLASVGNVAGDDIDVGVLDGPSDGEEQRLWRTALQEHGAFERVRVAGRLAFLGRSGRRAYVLGAKGVFVFDLTGKMADHHVLDAFLEKVDFDAE